MKNLRVLFFGDIVGAPGVRAVFAGLKSLIAEYNAHAVIANAENASDGFGLNVQDMNILFNSGVNVITSGNHIWQKEEIFPYLDSEQRLLRPENYGTDIPGHGTFIINNPDFSLGIINLQGRAGMDINLDCPYKTARKSIAEIKKKVNSIIVDFHAENTREKEAMAYFLDGKVSAVLGTHTHVQTTDNRILPGGTAVITDAGMCGPQNSVIGARPELSIKRSLTQLPVKMAVSDSQAVLQGVFLEIDPSGGKALAIERIRKRNSGDNG